MFHLAREALSFAESAQCMDDSHAAILYCERAVEHVANVFEGDAHTDWREETLRPLEKDLRSTRLQRTPDGMNVELVTPASEDVESLIKQTRAVIGEGKNRFEVEVSEPLSGEDSRVSENRG